jgi:imidazolonepropionase-like amidohydrolase
MSIVVDETGSIAEVDYRGEIPIDAELLDCGGLYLMPGLIDCHVHYYGVRDISPIGESFVRDGLRGIRASVDSRRTLEAGVTTVRDVGSDAGLDVRAAINEGTIPGPRVLAAGRFIVRTGGADDPTYLPLPLARSGYGRVAARLADGVDEVRRAVREQIRDGADWIKTCATGLIGSVASNPSGVEWTDAEIHALIDETHRLGRRVAVHAHAPEGIMQAVRQGADTIEHGTFLNEEAAAELARREIPLVPTTSWYRLIQEKGLILGHPEWLRERAGHWREALRRSLALAMAHGVPVAMGSDTLGDALSPHGNNSVELQEMVALGLSPAAAIVSATSAAARALGIQAAVGSVESGKEADLIAVESDPTVDIAALRHIRFVLQRGRVTVTDGVALPASAATAHGT